jgi:hypothetical protein
MYCHNCGNQHSTESLFCPHCGAQNIKESKERPVNTVKAIIEKAFKEYKKTWNRGKLGKALIFIITIMLWPVILLAIILYLYHHFENRKIRWLAIAGVLVITIPVTAGWYKAITEDAHKQKATLGQTDTSEGNCVGPDGKRIQLRQQACEEFNNAWKNKPQETKQEIVSIPSIEPTTQNSNPQRTNSTIQTKSTPSNTPIPQVNSPALTNNDDIYSVLKENAKQKWGNDYEMVQYSYNNQVEAYNWVLAQTEHPDIMAKAINKWGNDFEMVKYNYENQVEAYEWVNTQTEYPDIMSVAKSKWGDDYEMIKYEYENQVEAYKKL